MRQLRKHSRYAIVSLAATTLLTSCIGDGNKPEINVTPPNIGTITKVAYDGVSDDLLTAGLGKTGLTAGAPEPKPRTRQRRRRQNCVSWRSSPTIPR